MTVNFIVKLGEKQIRGISVIIRILRNFRRS